MDVALSRIAALALSSPYMTNSLTLDERFAFVRAVEQAKDQNSLPEDMADLLAKALASIPSKKASPTNKDEDSKKEETNEASHA